MMHGNSNIKFIVAKQAKEILLLQFLSAPEDGRKKRSKHAE